MRTTFKREEIADILDEHDYKTLSSSYDHCMVYGIIVFLKDDKFWKTEIAFPMDSFVCEYEEFNCVEVEPHIVSKTEYREVVFFYEIH